MSAPIVVQPATGNPAIVVSEAAGAGPPIGTGPGTVAAGDDSRIVGAAQKAANLSDLASAVTARSNLGLGTAATSASSAFDTAGAASTAQAFAVQRANHSGTQAAATISDLAAAVTGNATVAANTTKLAGIAAGATANATDAQLRDRATHTGTQSADTLTDGTTVKAFLATERTKLAGISAGATVGLLPASNLSDVTDPAASRTNLGLGTAATQAATAFDAAGAAGTAQAFAVQRANHTGTQSADTLTDGATVKAFLATERTKLSGIAAGATVGLLPASNLSDVASASTARTNLGLGTAATQASTAFATAASAAVLTLTPTATKTGAYTAAPQDLVLTDATSGAFTVTLPAAPADATLIAVKKLDASVNTVTVTCGGSDTYAVGGTTNALTVQGHAVTVRYQTATGKWITLSNDLPLAQVDTRYARTANNLSDLASAATARTNLGLGSAATSATTAFDASGAATTAQAAINTILGTGPQRQYTDLKQRLDRFTEAAALTLIPPQAMGFLAWNGPPPLASSNSGISVGFVFYIRIPILETISPTKMSCDLTTSGTAVSNAYMGIHSSDGQTLLAQTADISAAIQSGGLVTASLTSTPTLTGGDTNYVWGEILMGAATGASFLRITAQPVALNFGLTGANAYAGRSTAGGLTALPATFTPASMNISSVQSTWLALS